MYISQLGSLGHKMASAGSCTIRVAFPSLATAKLFQQASSCASDTGCEMYTRRFLAEPSAELYNSSKMQERQNNASSLSSLSSSIEHNKGTEAALTSRTPANQHRFPNTLLGRHTYRPINTDSLGLSLDVMNVGQSTINFSLLSPCTRYFCGNFFMRSNNRFRVNR